MPKMSGQAVQHKTVADETKVAVMGTKSMRSDMSVECNSSFQGIDQIITTNSFEQFYACSR